MHQSSRQSQLTMRSVRAKYSTGPVIANKSKQSQQHHAKLMVGQMNLDTFNIQVNQPQAQPSASSIPLTSSPSTHSNTPILVPNSDSDFKPSHHFGFHPPFNPRSKYIPEQSKLATHSP